MRRLLALLTPPPGRIAGLGLGALLAGAALLLAGCSNRERANPFDPLNPSSSGRPPGFVALAGNAEVLLRWQLVQGSTLIGYQVYRRGPGDPGFTALSGVLPANTSFFRDLAVVNGQDYAYRLHFVFVSGLGNLPAEDTATPGRAVPWLVENGGAELLRITADNRHVASRTGGFEATADVATNRGNGDVWVADAGRGGLVVYYTTSGVTVSVPGLGRPVAVAVDAYDGTGWVCDETRGAVDHFERDGTAAAFSIGGLDRPVDAAVDPQDGSVWVCERGADRVGRYAGAQALWTATVADPSRVAVDSTTREGWVTSSVNGTVTQLAIGGQVLGTVAGLVSPLGVAVDHDRGRIWIADYGAGQVIALRRDRSEEFRVRGLPDAGEVAVDLATGEAWAVLGAGGALVRLSPTGTVIRTQSGFSNPFAVSVDPGRR